MCLHNIIGKPEKTSGIGYKVYVKIGDDILTYAYNTRGTFIYDREILHIGDKLTAVKSTEWTSKMDSYETGFHIFANLVDAENYRPKSMASAVVKVQYDNARVEGTQIVNGGDEVPCIIADEITLLEIL